MSHSVAISEVPAAVRPQFRSSIKRTLGAAWPLKIAGVLSSVWMAAVLLSLLACIIAIATYYEASYGRLATAVMIYQSWWFDSLFVLLAINIFGAAAIRWPWQRRHSGFLMTHAGMLVLMFGFAQAGHDRLDGVLVVKEGEQASHIQLPNDYLSLQVGDRESRHAIQTLRIAGYPNMLRYLLSPIWPIQKELAPTNDANEALMQYGPYTITLDQAVQHAETQLAWGPATQDTNPHDKNAACAWQLTLTTPDNQKITTSAYSSILQHQRLIQQGPLQVLFDSCSEPLYAQDFLCAPTDLPATGRLLIYAEGQRHILSPSIGSKTQIGAYHFECIDLSQSGQFDGTRVIAIDDGSFNPVIHFRIDGPEGQREAYAWAALPDMFEQREHAVQVVFQHPQAQMLDDSGRSLGLLRLLVDEHGCYLHEYSAKRGFLNSQKISSDWHGPVLSGAPMQLHLHMHGAWYRAAMQPKPVAVLADKANDTQRFIKLSVHHKQERRSFWIARGQRQLIPLNEHEQLGIVYAPQVYDLQQQHGFCVELEQFHHDKDPGGIQSAAFSSDVIIHYPDQGIIQKQRVEMNEPLDCGTVTCYQSAYTQLPDGRYQSHFTVAADPGRWAKYLGSVLMCVGICVLYLMRRRPRMTAL